MAECSSFPWSNAPRSSLLTVGGPAVATDVAFIVACESNLDNSAFISQWPKDRHLRTLIDPNFGYYIIVGSVETKALGYVILEGLRDENDSLCIQRIVTTEKSRGIGRAAIKQIKKLAFFEFNTHRLWLDVKTFNTRAKHLYETEGFRIEGTLRDCIKKENCYESLIVLSLLKPEFEEQEMETEAARRDLNN
jgi:diamine N-acetyltransferase